KLPPFYSSTSIVINTDINSGSSYTVNADVTLEGCWNPTVWGQYCNQTVFEPKCVECHSNNTTEVRFIACGDFSEPWCRKINEPEINYVDVLGITEQLVVWGRNVTLNQATTNTSELALMCYARRNAIPDDTVGEWYFKVQAVYQSSGDKRGTRKRYKHLLFSGMGYVCLPTRKDRTKMFLEKTYPSGSFNSKFYSSFHLFANGCQCVSWVNKFLRGAPLKHSVVRALITPFSNTDGKNNNIYILYAREGTWIIGLKNPIFISSTPMPKTTMSILVEDCANQCSKHGIGQSYEDASGSTSCSCCSCDKSHWGFDFSIDLVSKEESVVFMASGVLSAIYHACDVGWWCALPFSVLQLMDFWLSFMAVVSVFVYLVIIGEAAKRTVHTIVPFLLDVYKNFIPSMSLSSSQQDCPNISKRQQNMEEQVVNLTKWLCKYYLWSSFLLGVLVLSMAAISWKLQTISPTNLLRNLHSFQSMAWGYIHICLPLPLSKETIGGQESQSQVAADGNHAAYELAQLNSPL
ncbi:NGX6/PGAP6/MYMK - like 2, partial [Theobroma cacao]